jgi:hypothetical protein
MNMHKLPIGIEDYKKLKTAGFYSVDKTLFIRELLNRRGEVNLFTRPRRFGKTLTLSMLKYFFENTCNEETNAAHRALFDGTKLLESEDAEEMREWMTAFPVISLTLKSAKQPSFASAYDSLKKEIAEEYKRHRHIVAELESEDDRTRFFEIAERHSNYDDYKDSLKFLSKCLFEVYGKNTIILIDEYDVPLENAYFRGFYDEMIDFIRSLFESALKTNENLELAVITGCLRISKESIFTGLNNLEIISILNASYGEYFGFTQDEVSEALGFFGVMSRLEDVRHWYNGYRFGAADVYNPWSVIKAVKALEENEAAFLTAYWANTSSNDIVKTLVEKADTGTKADIEALLDGNVLEKPVHEEVTYGELLEPGDNLWNFLFFTGYLTQAGSRQEGRKVYLSMKIPNEEIKSIYENTIMQWFDKKIKQRDLKPLYTALLSGDEKTTERELTEILMQTISYHDYSESYYHGLFLGLVRGIEDRLVNSNRESGLGRPDIIIKPLHLDEPVYIIELKTADSRAGLAGKCDEALKQIIDLQYEEGPRSEGYVVFVHCGIAFYKKGCLVKIDPREEKLL